MTEQQRLCLQNIKLVKIDAFDTNLSRNIDTLLSLDLDRNRDTLFLRDILADLLAVVSSTVIL